MSDEHDNDRNDVDGSGSDSADRSGSTPDDHPDNADEDTEQAGAGAEESTFLGFAAEDWMVILLVVGMVTVAAMSYSQYSGLLDGPSDADPELVQYCEDTATRVQSNASLPQGTNCDCVLPGEFDESRFSTDSDRLDNATQLFLVQCTMPNEQSLTVPVRRVKPGFNVSDQNSSIGENGTTVIE